jgi:uncharacterized SAM-binding protein YcdF (DUF218 family)
LQGQFEMTLQPKGMIVVLGSPNSEDGELYSIAKERCEVALAEYAKRPDWKILLTGGYGAHFNTTDQPHAVYLRHYLVKRGVPGQAIMVEFAESANTLQDASLSKPIILKYQVSEIILITSDYHVDRARYIFEREFADTQVHIEFSVSKTEEVCELDLKALRKHEQEALAKLRKSDQQA